MPPSGKSLEAFLVSVQTLSLNILQRLKSDGERKRNVIKLLWDAKILQREDFDLSGANLSDISGAASLNLAGSNLKGVNLDNAFLGAWNLSNSNLQGASFVKASLLGTNLSQADLSFVIFHYTRFGVHTLNFPGLSPNLSGAILLKTDLTSANIKRECLEGENPPLICKVKLPADIKVDPKDPFGINLPDC